MTATNWWRKIEGIMITPSEKQRFEEALTRIWVLPEFDNPKMRFDFLAEMPDQETYLARKRKTQEALTRETFEGLRACYEEPLLTRAQEYHQFRKYNLIKYLMKAKFLVGRIADARLLLRESEVVRNQVASSNLRLAISLARKYSKTCHWDDYIAEAYMSTLKTVDYFDYRRGFKFSTYATWALRQNLGRSAKVDYRRDTTHEWIGDRDVSCKSISEPEYDISIVRFEEIISRLPKERDRQIMRGRYVQGETLLDVALSLEPPVVKERIRQIEQRCLAKLRAEMNPA